MLESSLVERVRVRAGFAGRAETLRAVRATLMAIGERLSDDERALLAREVPGAFARALDRVAYLGDFDSEELYARVARHEAVGLGFAVEHAQIVCEVLGELMAAEPARRLRRALGVSIASLFDAHPEVPEIPRSVSAAGSTLATGRAGSGHPLSESRPDRAQASSVARGGNAHGETKLSSAQGPTQERLHETLASGRPGSTHPIAESKRH